MACGNRLRQTAAGRWCDLNSSTSSRFIIECRMYRVYLAGAAAMARRQQVNQAPACITGHWSIKLRTSLVVWKSIISVLIFTIFSTYSVSSSAKSFSFIIKSPACLGVSLKVPYWKTQAIDCYYNVIINSFSFSFNGCVRNFWGSQAVVGAHWSIKLRHVLHNTYTSCIDWLWGPFT